MEKLTIALNGSEYTLTEYVEHGYVNADLFNNVLNQARAFLKKVRDTHNHPDLNCKLYVYDLSEINAFTIKHAGQYLIAISVGGLAQLYNWFELWAKCKDVRKKFEIADDQTKEFSEMLFQNAVNFLAAHEYYHVMNGHCDLPETEEHFLYERSDSIVDKEHAVFLQCLEYDADCCATAACVNQILSRAGLENAIENLLIYLSGGKKDNSVKNPHDAKLSLYPVSENGLVLRLKMLYFAIYSVFKLFSDEEQISFTDFIEMDLYEYDHPSAGIRMDYVGKLIITVLEKIVGPEKAVEYWEKAFQWIMSFEKDILGANDPKCVFFAVALTEKGAKMSAEIANAWKYVKPRLDVYTHHKLAPYEEVTPSAPVLDEEGKPYV